MTRSGRRDLLVAIALAAVALALYYATLLPGFGGPEDTPKFQFVGHVLGTPHPPGYPLYVVLSHLFVQLPVGTIAYRANLFSAVMAALSCALAFWIARELGARWWAAAAAALGLAAGASFWRGAVFAEVYSLAAALVAAAVGLLLAWGNRGGSRRLLGAAAVFAAGLGNHLTIVGILPAAVLYVFRNRGGITRRVVVAAVVLGALGVAQYGFIILRTYQGATYLESGAESVRELVAIIKADRFAENRFAFTVAEVVETNIPAIAGLIASEMMPLGLVCLLAGVVTAMWRRSAGAGLVLGGAAGMLAMVVNMSGDLQGFITPVVVLLWPVAALGLDGLCSLRPLRPRIAAAAAAMAVAIAVAMPVLAVTANYAGADQSHQTATGEFLRKTYASLPDDAAIVAEDYFYDMAHEYFRTTGEAGPPRGITKIGFGAAEVREAAARGRRVFAFAGAAATLSAEGLWFERATLNTEPLDEWLQRLPPDSVVVGATAFAAVPFDPAVLGHAGARGTGRAAAFEAFVLVAGRRHAAWKRDAERASLVADEAVPRSHRPAAVEARADQDGAMVLVGGRPIGAASSGLVLAAFTPDGSAPRVFEFAPGDPMTAASAGAIYELKGETPCARLTQSEWSDVGTAFSTGSAVATLSELGAAAVEIQFASGAVKAKGNHLLGSGETTVGAREDGDTALVEWRFSRTAGRRPLFRLALNDTGLTARARVAVDSEVPAVTVCSHRSWRRLAVTGSSRPHVGADFESEAFFGAGWTTAERRPEGTARRGQGDATLLVPLDGSTRYRARLALSAPAPATIDVFVNGHRTGTCAAAADRLCEVPVIPSGSATTLRLVMSGGGAPSTFTFFGAWFEKISEESP